MAPRAPALVLVIGLVACAPSLAAPVVVVPLPEAIASAPPPPPAPLAAPTVEAPAPAPGAVEPPSPSEEGMVDGGAMVIGGVVSGNGPAPAASPTKPAQRARPKSTDWKCVFPAESDKAGIDEASVMVKITIDPLGKVVRVLVVSDPGHGFGREARACAGRQAFVPAADEQGKAVADTQMVRVRFVRPAP